MTKFKIEIIQGQEEHKPIFRNLMQFYQYDTSDYTLKDPNPFGQFDYKYLDHYWTDHGINNEGRRAYLIRVNGFWGGFVLVNNFKMSTGIDEGCKNIAEFFVMRKWRRQGIGKYVAHQIFDTFHGQWEVKQEKENIGAHKFWICVIDEYKSGNYERVESYGSEWDGPIIWFRN